MGAAGLYGALGGSVGLRGRCGAVWGAMGRRGCAPQFAVVQFSTGVQRHVDFSDFDRLSERDLERRVNEVQQSNGITQTATAIRIVLCVPPPPSPPPQRSPRR